MLIKEHEMNGLCLNYVTKSSKSSKKKNLVCLSSNIIHKHPKNKAKAKHGSFL